MYFSEVLAETVPDAVRANLQAIKDRIRSYQQNNKTSSSVTTSSISVGKDI
jgi:hypothetical protein